MHIFTLGALRVVWIYIFPGEVAALNGMLFMGVSLIICVVIGFATYRFIELPMARWFRQIN